MLQSAVGKRKWRELLVFYCPKRYEEKNKILLPFITFS